MSQINSLVIEMLMNILSALILLSCLFWCCLLKAVGGLADVCMDVVVPLVQDFFAWEGTGNNFDGPSDSNFEAGSSSNTPETTPVGKPVAAPLEYGQPVQHACTSPFSLAVSGRSHYFEAYQSGGERCEFVLREPSMAEAVAVSGRDTVPDGVSVVDDSPVVSEAPIFIITNFDEVSVSAEVNLQVEAAPAVEACVPNAYPVTEMDWCYDQVNPSYVDRMDIDPWWWQGVVLFEDSPEMMEIDVSVEGGLDGVDLDQPMQVMGAFPQVQEHSDRVACEDVLMANVMVQEHMESEAHSNRGVESDLYVADTVVTETPSFEGDHPVVSDASPEISKEGDVVLNRSAPIDFPTLPSTEVLDNNNTVLSQAPVQDQGSSEGGSGSAPSSSNVEQHPDGCQCSTCATVTRDVEEVRAVFALFEEEEEQEEAQEEARVPVTRTSRRSRLLGRR